MLLVWGTQWLRLVKQVRTWVTVVWLICTLAFLITMLIFQILQTFFLLVLRRAMFILFLVDGAFVFFIILVFLRYLLENVLMVLSVQYHHILIKHGWLIDGSLHFRERKVHCRICILLWLAKVIIVWLVIWHDVAYVVIKEGLLFQSEEVIHALVWGRFRWKLIMVL